MKVIVSLILLTAVFNIYGADSTESILSMISGKYKLSANQDNANCFHDQIEVKNENLSYNGKKLDRNISLFITATSPVNIPYTAVMNINDGKIINKIDSARCYNPLRIGCSDWTMNESVLKDGQIRSRSGYARVTLLGFKYDRIMNEIVVKFDANSFDLVIRHINTSNDEVVDENRCHYER